MSREISFVFPFQAWRAETLSVALTKARRELPASITVDLGAQDHDDGTFELVFSVAPSRGGTLMLVSDAGDYARIVIDRRQIVEDALEGAELVASALCRQLGGRREDVIAAAAGQTARREGNDTRAAFADFAALVRHLREVDEEEIEETDDGMIIVTRGWSDSERSQLVHVFAFEAVGETWVAMESDFARVSSLSVEDMMRRASTEKLGAVIRTSAEPVDVYALSVRVPLAALTEERLEELLDYVAGTADTWEEELTGVDEF